MDIDAALIALSLLSFASLIGAWILAPSRLSSTATEIASAPTVGEASQPAASVV
jgi:hypothetical protein